MGELRLGHMSARMRAVCFVAFFAATCAAAPSPAHADSNKPNLVVTVDTPPQNVSPLGGQAFVFYTIRNTGTDDAQADRDHPIWTALYVSDDPFLSAGDVRIAELPYRSTIDQDGQIGVGAFPTLPPLTPGIHYLIVKVDSRDTVSELDETDNVGAASMLVGDGVDLVPKNVQAPASSPPAGGPTTTSFEVKNAGNSTAGPSQAVIWFSKDATLDTQVDSPLTQVAVGSIAAGDSQTLSDIPITLPSSRAGHYFLIVQVDALHEVDEADEGNNNAAAAYDVDAIDLWLKNISGPPTAPATGGSIFVTFAIQNVGTLDAPPTRWAIYFSDDTIVDAGDIRLAESAPLAEIPEGNTASVSAQISLPPGLPGGLHYIVAKADARDVIAEPDENDNFDYFPITIASAPDLVVASASSPAPATSGGGPATIDYSVKNIGNANAGPSRLTITLQQGNVLLADRPVGLVTPGQTLSGQATVTLPPLSPGHYTLLVRADAAGDVPEADEGNNTTTASFDITGVDLVVQGVAAPPTLPALGGSVFVSFTIANLGNIDAGPTRWAVYLADDQQGTNAVLLAQAPSTAMIGAGGRESVSAMIQIPSFLSPGTRWLLVRADAGDTQQETDETNNASGAQTFVPAADFTAPVTTATVGPGQTLTGFNNGPVTVHLSSSDNLRVDEIHWTTGGPEHVVLGAFTDVPVSAEGATTITYWAVDWAGNAESHQTATVRIDTTAPTASCPAADGSWHGADVSLTCTAADGGSGLAPSTPASFALVTSVPAGTETADAQTGTRVLCDALGNCGVAGPVGGNKVDRRAPAIACDAPAHGWHGGNVTVPCTSADGGSGVAGAATFALSTNVAPGIELVGALTGLHQVCDAVGNCAVAGPFAADVDRAVPVVLCASPDGAWHGEDVALGCNASDGGAGVDGPASFQLSTALAAGSESANVFTAGRTVCDAVGNCVDTSPIGGNKVDKKAPGYVCAAPDGAWHAVDVALGCSAGDGGSGLATASPASFLLATSVAADSETADAATSSQQLCDSVGNCSSAGPISGNRIDKKRPAVTCDAVPVAWQPANAAVPCAAQDGGSGLATANSFALATNVPAGTEDPAAQTSAAQACDAVGNCAAAGPFTLKIDRAAPGVLCGTADGAWHAANVSVGCAAQDAGSGLASGSPASFGLPTTVDADRETANAATDTREICDVVGHCATAGPVTGNKIDRKAPSSACAAPDVAWHAANQTFSCTAADGGSGLRADAPASFSLATAVAAGAETAAAATGTRQLCDAVGNCSTGGPVQPVKVDRKAPAVACPSADGAWHNAEVVLTCQATDGGAGVVGPASANLTTAVGANAENADASTDSRSFCDAVGNCATGGPVLHNKVDRRAPSVSCGVTDGVWHGGNISIGCSAADSGSGLAHAASFGVATSVPAGAETANAATASEQVCDTAGNCATAGPVAGNKIDRKAPGISCASADGVWHAADVTVACTAADGGVGLHAASPASFTLATHVAAGTETADAPTWTRPVCDALANCTTAGPVGGNKIDKKAPSFSCPAPDGQWRKTDASFACTASDGGVGLAATTPAAFTLTTAVPANTQTANASTGTKTLCDQFSNCTTVPAITGNKIDKKVPTFSCAAPPTTWQSANVTVNCTAADTGGSGVDAATAAFGLSTTVAPGTELATAATGTKAVCDLVQNCVTAGPYSGLKIDLKPPTIKLTSPVAIGIPIPLFFPFPAFYSCSDTGAGLTQCAGPVANGGVVDTTSLGTKTFTVTAKDAAGNTATASADYTVGYGICRGAYCSEGDDDDDDDDRRRDGTTTALRFWLCDARGRNYSSPDIDVRIVDVDGVIVPGSPLVPYEPSRRGGGTYRYDLSTPLPRGFHLVRLAVEGVPIFHLMPVVIG